MYVLDLARLETGLIGSVLEDKLNQLDQGSPDSLYQRMVPQLRIKQGSVGHFGDDDSLDRAWAKREMGIDIPEESLVYVQLVCGLCHSENLLAEEETMFPGDWTISCLDCGATD
jgi:hypothetical protein